VAKTVTLTFYVQGGSPVTATADLQPFRITSFPDIVLNTFGLSNAAGQLEIKSSNTNGFEARARIFNAGSSAGEYGQSVPGLGLSLLNTQGYLYGLSGVNGNRVNVGIANPNATVLVGMLSIMGKNRDSLASESFTLQPHETRQFNDIFARFGITPQADVQVEFNTSDGSRFYLYASEVRNDTGDAIFIFGTSPNT
jgi:hypothetical protein